MLAHPMQANDSYVGNDYDLEFGLSTGWNLEFAQEVKRLEAEAEDLHKENRQLNRQQEKLDAEVRTSVCLLLAGI